MHTVTLARAEQKPVNLPRILYSGDINIPPLPLPLLRLRNRLALALFFSLCDVGLPVPLV